MKTAVPSECVLCCGLVNTERRQWNTWRSFSTQICADVLPHSAVSTETRYGGNTYLAVPARATENTTDVGVRLPAIGVGFEKLYTRQGRGDKEDVMKCYLVRFNL
jgi:hypothetical protein